MRTTRRQTRKKVTPSQFFAIASNYKHAKTGVETRRRAPASHEAMQGEGIVQTTKYLSDARDESHSGMHNLEIAGAIPAPATSKRKTAERLFFFRYLA